MTGSGELLGELVRPATEKVLFDPAQEARFEAVVRRNFGRVVQMLDYVFLDRELAADAAQEACVQLYLHWDELGRSAEPEAWLYRVALNRSKDYRRQISRRARLVSRLAETAPSGSSDGLCEPDDEFWGILARLPLRQRAAAALFYHADMSIVEISHVMGISEGAVNSHLNRARRALKQMLEARR
jgi:RNA polymerase sigma factor (sigma-70 family)